MDTDAQPAPTAHHHDFFDVYKLALEDLHVTRDLGQKYNSFYLAILTLLLTADAYEFATARYDQWAPTFATFGVMLFGILVTWGWRQSDAGLYQITENRYRWLRAAEKHPEMAELGADIFSEEYQVIYLPKKRAPKPKANGKDPGARKFRRFRLGLQGLFMISFIAIPAIIGGVTFFNLNPAALQAIQRAIP